MTPKCAGPPPRGTGPAHQRRKPAPRLRSTEAPRAATLARRARLGRDRARWTSSELRLGAFTGEGAFRGVASLIAVGSAGCVISGGWRTTGPRALLFGLRRGSARRPSGSAAIRLAAAGSVAQASAGERRETRGSRNGSRAITEETEPAARTRGHRVRRPLEEPRPRRAAEKEGSRSFARTPARPARARRRLGIEAGALVAAPGVARQARRLASDG